MPKPDKMLAKVSHALQAGLFQEAIDLLEVLVKKWPKNLDGTYLLGSVYAQVGRLDDALPCLLRAQAMAPKSPQIANNLGNIYRIQGHNEKALSFYSEAVRLDPNFSVGWLNRALTCTKLERWVEAIESFKRIDPAQALDQDVLLGMGLAYAATGNKVRAIECYEQVLSDDHDGQRGIQVTLARLRELSPSELPERLSDASIRGTYRKKARTWDIDVTRSDDTYFGPDHIAELLATRLQAASPDSLSILDLGCGTGACGSFLRSVANSLIGVDLSPEMLDECSRKALYDRLVEADITGFLASEEQRYDIVVAAGVFIMFSRLDGLLRRIRSLMNKAGVLAFTLYASLDKEIEVRHNDHFGHSAIYISNILDQTNWQLITLKEVVHETDSGLAQAGYAVLAEPAQ